MRVLKFRAWHKKEKYMQEVDGYYLYLASGRIYESTTKDWHGMELNDVTDQYELMQFTGLLDKNGKDIYEGDIVTGLDAFRELKTAEVIYDDGGFYPLHEGEFYWKDIEVIGNIFDNPELLKD